MSTQRENFVALIQARMSSKRLPGKVLKPLAGRPMLEHVALAAAAALSPGQVIVATSNDPTDDAVAEFCRRAGYAIFRGPLDDVVARLQGALRLSGARAFFRICADSPFYDPNGMRRAMEVYTASKADLVTNVFPRSFPKGRSIELARAAPFLALNSAELSAEEREHVFKVYYENPSRFRVENFSAAADHSRMNLCVDTEDDWRRADQFLRAQGKPAHEFGVEELAGVFGEAKS